MLAYLLIKTSRNLKSGIDKAFQGQGITSTQFAIMNQIDLMGNRCLASEIASAIGSDRPTVSGVIQRLYSQGIINKIDNEKDRRSQIIELTPKGYKRLFHLRGIADDLSQEIFGHLSVESRDHLIHELQSINHKLGDDHE